MADDGRITCGTFPVGTFAVDRFRADQEGGFPPRRGRQRGFEWDRDWRRSAAERGAIANSGEPTALNVPADVPGRLWGYSAADSATHTIVGGFLTEIADNGGGLVPLTQATAGAQPTIATTPNGNVGILSDGVDDRMTSSLTIPAGEQTLVFVASSANVAATGRDLCRVRLGTANEMSFRQNLTDLACFRNAKSGGDLTITVPGFFSANNIANYGIFRFRLQGAPSFVRHRDGEEVGGTAPTTVEDPLDNFAFLANANGSASFPGYVHECHYWPRFLDDDEVDFLATFFEANWTIGP
jgi:hypothetical protein